MENACRTGFAPPKAFMYLNNTGLIQDTNKIPIIYQTPNRVPNKNKNYEAIMTNINYSKNYKYIV